VYETTVISEVLTEELWIRDRIEDGDGAFFLRRR
jgi:hypothetical protein